MADNEDDFRELVADVAAAYFSNSHVGASDIPNVIQQIAASLKAVGSEQTEQVEQAAAPAVTKTTPAQARKSITPDAIISFEDGKSYKTMKRHLSGRGLTPQQYREKWGLPSDYPMVAPNYSAARSQMAKNLGLGQLRKNASAAKPKPKAKAPGAKRGPKPKVSAAS